MMQIARLRTCIDEDRYAVEPLAVADALLRRLARLRSARPTQDAVSPRDAQSPRGPAESLPAS